MEEIKLEVNDGELSAETFLTLPIQEHANSIGIFVNLENHGENEQAFVNMIYELNEKLKETANHILRMDKTKTSQNYLGSITNQGVGKNILTLEEWKEQLPNLNKNTSFSFHPKMKNGKTSWTVTSFLDNQSSTDTNLDNNKSYTNPPIQNAPLSDESNSSENASGTDTELVKKENYIESEKKSQKGDMKNQEPVKTLLDISDISSARALESAPNWYTMPGLGSFFSTGNGWIYQPELGWCFTQVCPDGCSTWIFNETLGWMWMSNELTNMTYSFGQLGTGWIFFP